MYLYITYIIYLFVYLLYYSLNYFNYRESDVMKNVINYNY